MIREIFSVFPELSTERLNLRKIKPEDAESIYLLLSDPEVIKHDTFELFTSVEQAENLISWFNDKFEENRSIFWGICLKDNPEIIGLCKCEIEIPKVRADIGYDLRRDFWNKGIMTEALREVISFVFDDLYINRIEAAVSTENLASVKVLEKIGFVKEGVLRQRSYLNGSCHDMAMLSILKEEYCNNKDHCNMQ